MNIERAGGRGDAVRLCTRGRLRRVTAPEGRARGQEQSGRPHRLHEAAPWHCYPRTPGGRCPTDFGPGAARTHTCNFGCRRAFASTALVTRHGRTSGGGLSGQPERHTPEGTSGLHVAPLASAGGTMNARPAPRCWSEPSPSLQEWRSARPHDRNRPRDRKSGQTELATRRTP
jgi:hypothetical protein